MRCTACDRKLEDFESKKRNDVEGNYEDLCNRCYKAVQTDLEGGDKDFYAIQHDKLDDDLMNLLGIGD